MSYGVYLMQAPVLAILSKLALLLTGARLSALPQLPVIAATLPLVLALGWYVTRRFDEPARAWLRRLRVQAGDQAVTTRPRAAP